MSVYSKRLGGPLLTTANYQVLGTVPAGKLWIIRWVVALSTGAAMRNLFTIGPIANVTRFYDYAAIFAHNAETRLVMNAGESINVVSGTAGVQGWVSIHGYELDA